MTNQPFWRNVEKGADDECWRWTGSRKTVDDPWVVDGIEDEYELAKRFNPAAEEQEDDE